MFTFAKLFFGIKENSNIHSLTFYTRFKLKVYNCKLIDEVITLGVVEQNRKLDANKVWFIGQPLVENNILSNTKFEEIMRLLFCYCKQNKLELTYIAHRAEENRKDKFDSYVNFNVPVESLVFDPEVNFPQIIVSFYSTALINLKLFLPQACCFYLDISRIAVDTNLLTVYDYFKRITEIENLDILQSKIDMLERNGSRPPYGDRLKIE